MTSSHYPLFVSLEAKKCFVVGGGTVAERKVESLLKYGADVLVLSPDFTERLEELAREGRIRLERGEFESLPQEDFFLVFGATCHREVQRKLSLQAQSRNIMVNIVDEGELSDFITPSMVKRGDLTIAVSTGGKSPALAASIRRELEEKYGKDYGPYVDILGELRKEVLARINDEEERRELFYRLTAPDAVKKFRDLGPLRGREMLRERVEDYCEDSEKNHGK